MGLALQQPHNNLPTLNVVCQVYQIKININLVDELRHARAIHLAVKGRRQCRLYSSGELGLGPVMKSLINGFLCIQISLQLCNFILHTLKQLHQLLYISGSLGSHIDICAADDRGVLQST